MEKARAEARKAQLSMLKLGGILVVLLIIAALVFGKK